MSLAAFLDLRGEVALIVGGGAVALRRAATLLASGLDVRVVAPAILPDLAALPVRAERRPYAPADLTGVRLVVAATDDAALNDAVAEQARAAGVLVNHAGEARRGTLRFPAVAERAGVQVAVSTGRELPMLARALRESVQARLPDTAELNAWTTRREDALTLAGPERAAALGRLDADICRAVGGAA
ncbi:bifunctional precorrin-2 dehydrogenase/sirohydrochlorin ferrochelatase [Deinococcus sp. Leaf326]|uniref:precorrin-2 dehydrogenase/sirohydrochlorin ferrochelatase family protein n=1 Tax=Deinococcus sp. Leaf326 TaxID=1736338 RepID=UPI000B0720FA|nr:bifunctional precorrin-2 dehydrogenase/sirohydrochlorin ferrochelatase [Deinococcus sp. Leaf326]